MMSTVLPYLLSGVSVGGQYALIAIGYTMVYGILRLINFAHGDVFMVAGILMVYISASGLPLYVSIPLVLVLTAFIGFLSERVAYKPLASAPRMSIMISASVSAIRYRTWFSTSPAASISTIPASPSSPNP